jgi:hypothetical protein
MHINTPHYIAQNHHHPLFKVCLLCVSHLERHGEPHYEGVVNVPQYRPLCLRVFYLVLADNIIFLENLRRRKPREEEKVK